MVLEKEYDGWLSAIVAPVRVHASSPMMTNRIISIGTTMQRSSKLVIWCTCPRSRRTPPQWQDPRRGRQASRACARRCWSFGFALSWPLLGGGALFVVADCRDDIGTEEVDAYILLLESVVDPPNALHARFSVVLKAFDSFFKRLGRVRSPQRGWRFFFQCLNPLFELVDKCAMDVGRLE